MRRIAWLLPLFAVLAAFFVGGMRRERPPPSEVLPWSVKVIVPAGSGSGTVIGYVHYQITGKPITYSLVVTCAHVMTDDFHQSASPRAVLIHDGKPFPSQLIAISNKLDLAILLVKQHWAAAPLYWGPLAAGERELVAGAALGTHVGLTSGYIGSWQAKGFNGRRVRQGTATAWPGNSGGGVFVDRGGWRLAGVMEAIPTIGKYGMLVPQISLFIPMSDLRKFLAAAGIAAIAPEKA